MTSSAAALRGEPAIVLDVRGNDGGADNAVSAWFSGITDGELRYNTIDELTSEVTCQGTLNVVTCDERATTAGTGVFGEARSYRLPKSGLGLQAGIKWFHNEDPRLDPVEGRGYLPDLWIDSERTPAIAEKLALCLGDPACARRLGVR